MNIQEMQQEILRLKKENDVCILAHAYQSHEIWEIADEIGDSFGLCQKAAKSPAGTILMCGVRFMAETAKILSPQKRVLLSHPEAGCPMAEQIDSELVLKMKEELPDCTVAAYINTTAELKTVCDVCVTSSSAVKIIRKLPNQNILFLPDRNLGEWVAKQIPEKNIHLVYGGCPTHLRITEEDVRRAKESHPEALLLVHPECRPAVTAHADFAGSTTEIMKYAQESKERSFIIGTENSIVEHLQMSCPEKQFFPLSKDCICHNMKLTTLGEVYNCLRGIGGEEITLEPSLMDSARKCIDGMLAFGG